MWRKVAAFMRFDGFGPGAKTGFPPKPNPLRRRPAPAATPLVETPFAPNPGNLRMFCALPLGLKPGAPLVVSLHGCGQSAAGYDAGAGWSQLATRLGFAVLAPEQKAVNNPGTCFNWFNPEDASRGQGEAASIAAMIRQMLTDHSLDPKRIFITGLSAGGAMTAAMLASYPELFAGGAIVAGLPYGAAANIRDALDTMRSAPLKTPRAWGDAVRGASDFTGPWPRVSIWHGDLDTTVNVNNAQASAAQWADVHGLALKDAVQETVDGAVRLRWSKSGKPVLEVHTIPGLGHGTPIDSSDLGHPAPFILEAGISSTAAIADFWGLDAAAASNLKPQPKPIVTPPPAKHSALPTVETVLPTPQPQARTKHQAAPKPRDIEGIILRALKAAGLLKKR
jgi:poly(hydroxyalkanoate) depolymerase family esterase